MILTGCTTNICKMWCIDCEQAVMHMQYRYVRYYPKEKMSMTLKISSNTGRTYVSNLENECRIESGHKVLIRFIAIAQGVTKMQ
jgi:hypothetical protein